MLRRWRKLADGYDPHRVLIGETYVLDPTQLGSFYGDDDELNLAFNFMLLHSKFHAPAAARRRSSRPSSYLPGERVAGVDRRQPRQPPLPVALVRRRSREDPRRDGDADGPARHAVPLLRRRDRHARHRRSPRTACSTRSACSTARAWAATPSARRCSGPASRARASPSRASSRGSRTATSPRATSPTSATIPTRCSR